MRNFNFFNEQILKKSPATELYQIEYLSQLIWNIINYQKKRIQNNLLQNIRIINRNKLLIWNLKTKI